VEHKHTVVFSPEGEMPSPDQVLEHKPNHSPRNVIQTCCRWDGIDTTKQDSEGKRHWSVWNSSMELGPVFFSGLCTTLTGSWMKGGITPSDCIREVTCRMNVLDIGDPRSGISLGECPCNKRAKRSDQKEPKQALRSVSGNHS